MRARAPYLILAAAMLALYFPVFRVWFLGDDFAWLSLRLQPLGDALFRPFAQGTVRIFSERLPFLAFGQWFGLNPLPFRVLSLITFAANLVLAARIGRTLSGSRIGGFAAASLWMLNARVLVSVSWASAYNQQLYSFCLLAAFYCLLRYLDTGRRGYLLAQWIFYLAGFGALEVTVVYPALAAAYCVLLRPKELRSVLPMFIPASVFAALHLFVIPKPSSATYAMSFDAGLVSRLWRYFVWTLGPEGLAENVSTAWKIPEIAIRIGCGVGLAAALISRPTRENWFAAAWFLLLLAPVLPLAGHVTDYYLTLPSLGLCWIAGSALAAPPTRLRAAAFGALALAYAAGHVAEVRAGLRWYAQRTAAMRDLVGATREAHRRSPASAILLAGVDRELFESGFQDEPFRLFGLTRVFLAPGTENAVRVREEIGSLARWRMAPEEFARLLAAGEAVVLVNEGGFWDDETARYRTIAGSASGRVIMQLGEPAAGKWIREGWHSAENGFRWTSRRAVLGLPFAPRALVIHGYAPALVVPVDLRLSSGTIAIGSTRIRQEGPFRWTAEFAGTARELTIEVDRTRRAPGDPRDLGVIIQSVELR
ncbi:MAG: hypothetical protein K2X35_19010 [Bryobacteraceae bacterium]|nr:hypothetical protein [Bryobacteraceae bacterium]